jgi:hypothetical protein
MKLHEMKQKRNTIAADMRALHEKLAIPPGLTNSARSGAMKSSLTRWMPRLLAKKNFAARIRLILKIRKESSASSRVTMAIHSNRPVNAAAAFNGFLRRGVAELSAEERQALRELRAQGTSPDEQGGYTVPTQFQNRIVESMRAYGGIASISQILTTATGQDIAWSTSDGTTEEGELLAENTAASEVIPRSVPPFWVQKNSPPKSSVYPMNCCRIAVWILRHFLRHALRPVLDAVRRNTLCWYGGRYAAAAEGAGSISDQYGQHSSPQPLNGLS